MKALVVDTPRPCVVTTTPAPSGVEHEAFFESLPERPDLSVPTRKIRLAIDELCCGALPDDELIAELLGLRNFVRLRMEEVSNGPAS